MSFDQMKEEEEADCIEPSVQDQVKVTGHSNIYESNLPNID